MKKLFVVLFAVAALVYLAFSYFFSDIQINKYEDVQTVKEQKAIEQGWIPALLPESSFGIVETHDLENGSVFGRFKYKEEDEASLMKKMMSMDDNVTMQWENFLFKIDKEKNLVKFRNRGKDGL